MRIYQNKYFFILLLLVSGPFAIAHEFSEETLPKVGNFALRPSQRPVPLFSFAQFMPGENVFQIFNYYDAIRGTGPKFNDTMVTLVYGITDKLSILLNFPFNITAYSKNSSVSTTTVDLQTDTSSTALSGLQNVQMEMEYAFYFKFHQESFDRATCVFNMAIPPGHIINARPQDVIVPTFFFGLTYCHMSVDWYYYLSDGFFVSTPYRQVTHGTQLLYQAGLGRNLHHFQNWILMAMVEANGIFTRPSRLNGIQDPNTGSNLIYMGPSLTLSSNNLFMQLGAQLVPYQHQNGVQSKQSFWISSTLSWTF